MGMKWRALSGAAAVALLAGCAAQDHYYSNGVCVTCVNNPLTGEPINYDPETTPLRRGSAASEAVAASDQQDVAPVQQDRGATITIDSPVDVDTAYARLKPAMRFRSPNDFEQGNKWSKWAMGDVAWKHQVTPGAYYNLGDYGRQTLNGTEYHILQRLEIQKNGAGSRIKYSWSPSDNRERYDGDAMTKALEQRIRMALN